MMPQRISLIVGRGVGLLAVVATICGGDAARAQTGSAASAQAAGLSPILRNVLAEALSREEAVKKGGPPPSGFPPASFPLPVCLFRGGLCGAINRDGSIAVEPRFDFVDEFHEGRAVVRLHGLYGYVDTDGKVVVEPQYAMAGQYWSGLAEVRLGGKAALIDRGGRQVFGPRFVGVVPFTDKVFWVNDGIDDWTMSCSPCAPPGAEQLARPKPEYAFIPFRSGAKWGLIDASGAWIRPPEFADIAVFDSENAELMWATRAGPPRWGLMKSDGTWLIEPAFSDVKAIVEDRAEVLLDGRVGYVDRSGKVVIQPRFEVDVSAGEFAGGLGQFSDGLAPAKLGGLFGLIDQSGNWVVEPKYDRVFAFSGKGFWVGRGGKFGVLDPSGKLIVDVQIERKPRFQMFYGPATRIDLGPVICADGRIAGLIDQKPHLFARDGTPMTLAQGEIWESPPCEGPIMVKVGDRFGYVNEQLQPITEPKFEFAGRFKEGLAVVKLGGKYGLLRPDGSFALEPRFDAAQPLRGGKALVKLDGVAGIIDVASLAWISRTPFDDACDRGWGLVGVMRDGKMGASDEDGNLLFPPTFDPWISVVSFQGLMPVHSGDKWTFIGIDGAPMDAGFDDVSPFERGISWVNDRGNWCAIDRHGGRIPHLACQTSAPNYVPRFAAAGAAICKIPQ